MTLILHSALPYTRPPSPPPSRFQEAEWQAIQAIADDLMSQLRAAYLAAVGNMQADVNIDRLINLIQMRNTTQAIQAIDLGILQEELAGASTELMREALARAGNTAVEFIPGAAGGALRFDLVNPRAFQWANVQAAQLVTGVTSETQAAIRYVISRAIRDGLPPREAAELIQSLVGLLPRHAAAVYNLREGLLASGKSAAIAQAQSDRYAAKLLRYRAENIARTEIMRASNAGQVELWQQAAERGFLNRSKTRQVWIVTPDDRLCESCRPMQGQQVAIGGEFTSNVLNTTTQTPPLHPSCRCALGLVFL